MSGISEWTGGISEWTGRGPATATESSADETGLRAPQLWPGRAQRPSEPDAPSPDARGPAGPAHTVAATFEPLLTRIFSGRPPVRFLFWDGSRLGASDGPGTVHVRSRRALRRLLWSPNELGLARAFVSGELDVAGDLSDVFGVLAAAGRRHRRPDAATVYRGVTTALRVGAVGPPLARPAEEARSTGQRHSKRRDSDAVGYHYDVGNEFYRLVLGPSLVYSCARFVDPSVPLETAQEAKLDLVCRKLGLDTRPGARLLDVGCGWGSLALHAARHYGSRVVGITLSHQQADLARKRIADAGLAGRIEVRLQDYRDLRHERFDAISSIGMSEHVGHKRMAAYFDVLFAALAEGGRLLNHAISRPGGSSMGRSFMGRYVFPDGELIDLGTVILAMQQAGLEVRDVESLREHYVRTLQAWEANLVRAWDRAVARVGRSRARVWRLYMAGSANAFARGVISVHQVLAVKPMPDGSSLMPATRGAWT